MTRNRDYAAALGRGLDDLDANGNADAPAGTAVRSFSTNDDLLTADNSSYTDGQLHYMTNTNDLWIWDDSDGKFYEVTLGDPPFVPSPAQGETAGFTAASHPFIFHIQKYNFASDGNAVDYADVAERRTFSTGASSSTDGYIGGGRNPTSNPGTTNTIQKFSFTAGTNATDIADLTTLAQSHQPAMSTTHGYWAGGLNYPLIYSDINKFSFSTQSNASDVADLVTPVAYGAGQSSTDHGYSSGGASSPSARTNKIQKFPFASDANSTDVGTLTVTTQRQASSNSHTHGYNAGGEDASYTNVLDKFPFASDGSSSNVGDLLYTDIRFSAGSSSMTHGYIAGGGGSATNNLSKYSFSSDGDATDVGNMAVNIYGASGFQF